MTTAISQERIDAEIQRQFDAASKRIDAEKLKKYQAESRLEEARAAWDNERVEEKDVAALDLMLSNTHDAAARKQLASRLAELSDTYTDYLAAIREASAASQTYYRLSVQLRCEAAECNGVYFDRDIAKAAAARLALSDAGQPGISLLCGEAKNICEAAGILL